jgi:hypothetical protein
MLVVCFLSVAANGFKEDADFRACTQAEGIPAGWLGLDIGTGSSSRFAEVVGRANTILWNGPMGVFGAALPRLLLLPAVLACTPAVPPVPLPAPPRAHARFCRDADLALLLVVAFRRGVGRRLQSSPTSVRVDIVMYALPAALTRPCCR